MHEQREKILHFFTTHKKPLLWIGSILLLGVLILGLFAIFSKSPDEIRRAILEPKKDDWILGDTHKARAVVVMYSDFACSACDIYHSTLKKLHSELGDDLAIIFRHYPLSAIHPHALNAALVAEAAGNQGKFFEMQDLLFQNHQTWARAEEPDTLFLTYAQTLNLDEEKFLDDAQNADTQKKILRDEQDAEKLGVKEVPYFFINTESVPPLKTYKELETYIRTTLYK